MADASVTLLLENLSQLLISHSDLVSGAEDELRRLINELVQLKDFLQDAASRLKKDAMFREMEREIKEVVHDAEDSVDACLAHLTAAKDNDNILRRRRRRRVDLTNPTPPLAQVVKSIREDRLKPVLDKALSMDFGDMQIGHQSDTTIQEEQRPRLQKLLSIGRDNIVGLEDEEDKMVDYLSEERDELDVITIVGMPGLGKTTLAWKVYYNHKIQHSFPTRIWVYVSQEFNLKTVFLNILQEFTSKDMSSESDHDLALAIHACFQEKKFLLVLDDVWSAEAWYAIQDALPKSNRRGKVLITSRSREVAMYANPNRPPHMLRLLSQNEGWELLSLKALGNLHQWPQELEIIGKRLSTQCNGLPIMILMIAGILVDQLSKSRTHSEIVNAWIQLSQDLSAYTHMGDLISSILALCYDKLHDELRDCFLYLGVFPEDYEIPVWTLTQLWIAEGFIQPKQGQSLEETAEENLNDLIHRNLVKVDKMKADGKVKTCRIHDIVRDFCIMKGESEEKLFQELRRVDSDEGSGPRLQNHRRLCIHFNILDFFSTEPHVPHVRSFLTFSNEELALQTEDIPKIPAAFELIRVLHIKPIRLRIFPLQLTQLVYLKYIVLSSDFKVLPKAFSELRNMQTLIIQTSSRTLVVKADIWKMIQLRHVKTNTSIILPNQPEENEGKNLQTLANISPENCTTGLFEQTPCLMKLGIRGRLSTSKLECLGKLNSLENLKLLNDVHTVSPSEGRLPSLPPPDTFPPRLRILTLSATFLSWDQVSVLGNLEHLEVLKLKEKAFVGKCWEVVDDGGFRLLRYLLIEHTDLVSWKLALGNEYDHFPRLKHLELRNCEGLEALPDGLADLRSLEAIDLYRTSKTAVDSARRIQQELSNRVFALFIFPLYE